MALQAPNAPRTVTYRCPHCSSHIDVDASAAGTMVNCPAIGCGKPFRVEVPTAEPVQASPALILPPGVEPPRPTATPVVAPSAPATSQAVETALQAAQPTEIPETPGVTLHLSLVRRYPFRFLGYLLLAGASVALIVWSLQQQHQWLAIAGGVVLVVVLLRLLVWWLRMHRTTLTVSNKRGILATGVFHRDTSEFPFSQIADFHISQSMLMRWLDVGDLAVVTTSGRHVVIMALPDPHTVAAHLQTHVDAEKKAAETPDLVVVQPPA